MDDGSIHLHQTSFARKILGHFNPTNCGCVTMPADVENDLERFDDSQAVFFYRKAVGSVLYLLPARILALPCGSHQPNLGDLTKAHERKKGFKIYKSQYWIWNPV